MFWYKKAVSTEESKVNDVLTRGVVETIDKENIKNKMLSGKRLTVKLGIDPTSPNIHLGRSVVLLKLRDFQELGHKIVLIIGDATGMVGDTSDKNSERPMLSKKQVEINSKGYLEQAGKILDMGKTDIKHNSKWLNNLSYNEIGSQADNFSVSDFVSRENIKNRLDEGKRVTLREVLYPLMQGYDSVAIESDIEIGGTDQKFNLLAGRTLQKAYGQEPQDILMTELVEGTDGRKMSSSWGNTINVLDEANDMYGKVMSISDGLIEKYFMLMTRVPKEKIEEMKNSHPKQKKMVLAKEITKMYHGPQKADLAEKYFTEAFSEKTIPQGTETIEVKKETPLVDLLKKRKIVKSSSEFYRLIDQGAIHNMETGEKIQDKKHKITKDVSLKIGKKTFVKIEVI